MADVNIVDSNSPPPSKDRDIEGPNRDLPVEIEWFTDLYLSLPEWLQWTFFAVAILFGTWMELSTNTRFLWPCWSSFAKVFQACYAIAFYWAVFAETETTKFVIAILVYLTHIFDVAIASDCEMEQSQSF